MNYLLVFFGGGIGSVLRFLIGRISAKLFPSYPLGTVISNCIGMFLIGFLGIVIIDKNMIISPFREMILIGFIGGLTTYSSFGYEAFMLFSQSRWFDLFLYFLGNIFLGFLLFLIGRLLGNL